MLGNKTKVSSLTGKHAYNTDFDKLLSDADHGKLKNKSKRNFKRAAYYGTSQSTVPDFSVYDGRRLYAKSAERSD